jgi:hypothetical protein
MARVRDISVGSADLKEYLNGYSDFSFELQTLKTLRAMALDCEHGGLYQDPVTKKSREFDIRAVARADGRVVHLAIECKNISASFPLLVSCVPRHDSESYHEVGVIRDQDKNTHYSVPAMFSRARIAHLEGDNSCYKPLAPVGKSLAQVGRSTDKEASIVASDSEVFDKWSQCLASADDLVRRSYWEPIVGKNSRLLTMVLPIVVVPNDRLWAVEYDNAGSINSDPKQVEHCSFFVDKEYAMGSVAEPAYKISHLEILTSNGLMHFVEQNLSSAEAMVDLFPINPILHALTKTA